MVETTGIYAKARRAGWVLSTVAVLPLALVGCQPRQPVAPQANAPQERVAGERQEQIDTETLRVVQQAGLPETFAFGGRTWRANQVHWIEDEPGEAADIGGAAEQPGTGPLGIGTYRPVGNLMVNNHQVYRQSGTDEAVTDNIFLRAENATPPAGQQVTTPEAGNAPAAGETPTTGEAGETGQTGETGETAATQRVAFVEYDAGENLVENMELPNILQATGLPETVQYGGKTWRAQEIQVYDADVFDEAKQAPQPIGGQSAFIGEDQEMLLLQAELDPSQMTGATGTGTPGTTEESPAAEGNAPAAEGNAPGTTGTESQMLAGPIFVRYQAE